ncbi:MAG: hypothetical protein Ct9H300mP28_04800 [Pseudomonadota bacterium]|nr:MAG: hypothetical protein Ct9H300mP28_04800 [Pseudomonadota bacterium]
MKNLAGSAGEGFPKTLEVIHSIDDALLKKGDIDFKREIYYIAVSNHPDCLDLCWLAFL